MAVKTLEQKVFEKDIRDLVEKSDAIFDGWVLRTFEDGRDKVCYAEKRGRRGQYQLEHHILYSPSYQVPVIYFRVYDSKGQLVTDLESVVRTLTLQAEGLDPIEVDGGLTQMPHPIHQTPFFQIHPCKTAAWMDSVFVKSSNYILSWLSYVGPNVGIHLDNHYFFNTNDQSI